MDYAAYHGRQGGYSICVIVCPGCGRPGCPGANNKCCTSPSPPSAHIPPPEVAAPLPLPPKRQLEPEDPLPERPSDRPPSTKKWRDCIPAPIR